MSQGKRTIMPPVWFLMSVAAMLLLAWVEPWGVVDTGALGWAGLGMSGLALLTIVLIGQQYRREGITIIPFHEPPKLMIGGLFRLSRNPIYLCFVIALGGWALFLGALSPWIIVIAYAVLLHYWFILPEETMLGRLFGAVYEQYRQQVNRWL